MRYFEIMNHKLSKVLRGLVDRFEKYSGSFEFIFNYCVVNCKYR